jgi:hypothetical protein
MRLLEPSRYLAIIAVISALALGFTLVDVALRSTWGLLPESLLRNEYLKADDLSELGGRVVAVEASPPNEPLAVLLGFSTVREAFVPSLLEGAEPEGSERRWLNLGGSGASFYELDYYVKPLLRSSLRPELIAIGMHPVWMAGRLSNPKLVDAGPGDVLATLQSRRLGELKGQVIEWSWLAFNRNRANLGLQSVLASARERLFLGLDLPQRFLYPASANPWLEERRYDGHIDHRLRGIQMGAWERFHWFEPAQYQRSKQEALDALEVIRACQERARSVVLVYMPEGRELRARVPPDAEATFEREVLARLEPRPLVIDLRAELPESAFYDHIHVNESGRPLASTLLVRRLAQSGGK